MSPAHPPSAGGVNRRHAKTITQKTVFSGAHFGILVLGIWLLGFGGWETIGALFGRDSRLPNPARGWFLLGVATFYWLRHTFTLFSLLVRAVDWAEVWGLLVFFSLFEIGFILIGAGAFRNTPPLLTALDYAGLALLLAGSYINSGSEIQRKRWKQQPENKGHCYTGGLFTHSQHINFFGDIVLFTGWALLTGSFWALVLPVLMTYLFITQHIPALDTYLENRYGQEFMDYAAKTKKLIPFVY